MPVPVRCTDDAGAVLGARVHLSPALVENIASSTPVTLLAPEPLGELTEQGGLVFRLFVAVHSRDEMTAHWVRPRT